MLEVPHGGDVLISPPGVEVVSLFPRQHGCRLGVVSVIVLGV